MWLVVTPYFRQCGPPAFSATLPPTVETFWDDGSGAKKKPPGVVSSDSSRLTTPGWTSAVRSA